MYQYSIKDKEAESAVDKTYKSQKLSDEFDKIDKKFNDLTNTNVDLNLQELDYIAPTKEDVKQRAENNLKDYKDKSLQKIENDFNSEKKSLNDSIASAETIKQDKIDMVKKSYGDVKENESANALKRGLGRSSIALLRQYELNDEMMNKISDFQQAASKQVDELNAKLNLLEGQKQSALGAFDIEYAIKLQDKIDSINSELAEKQENIIKYNNQIKELQAKHQKEQDETNFNNLKDLAGIYAKYGTGVVDEIKNNQKYQVAKEYFKNMSNDDAVLELESNPNYKTQLGSYYNRLLKELKG